MRNRPYNTFNICASRTNFWLTYPYLYIFVLQLRFYYRTLKSKTKCEMFDNNWCYLVNPLGWINKIQKQKHKHKTQNTYSRYTEVWTISPVLKYKISKQNTLNFFGHQTICEYRASREWCQKWDWPRNKIVLRKLLNFCPIIMKIGEFMRSYILPERNETTP